MQLELCENVIKEQTIDNLPSTESVMVIDHEVQLESAEQLNPYNNIKITFKNKLQNKTVIYFKPQV